MASNAWAQARRSCATRPRASRPGPCPVLRALVAAAAEMAIGSVVYPQLRLCWTPPGKGDVSRYCFLIGPCGAEHSAATLDVLKAHKKRAEADVEGCGAAAHRR